jgi:hypothetical protein
VLERRRSVVGRCAFAALPKPGPRRCSRGALYQRWVFLQLRRKVVPRKRLGTVSTAPYCDGRRPIIDAPATTPVLPVRHQPEGCPAGCPSAAQMGSVRLGLVKQDCVVSNPLRQARRARLLPTPWAQEVCFDHAGVHSPLSSSLL